MKFKSFYLLALVILLSIGSVSAQEKTESFELIDNAQIRVLYEFTQEADKRREKITLTDTLALNIGSNWSEFYDWHKVKLDSLESVRLDPFDFLVMKNDDDELLSRLEAGEKEYKKPPRKPYPEKIYKNRNANQITTYIDGPFEAGVGPTYLVLEESISPLDWSITSETSTVLNYSCTKATTTFRGRNYEAWFTTDIPVNDGPWKLYGLPGLILKAETDDGVFKYNAIGIEKMENSLIYLPVDKKKTLVKDLKQLQDFRRNKNRKVGIVLVKDGEATNYTIDNPVLLNTIELIN